MRIEKLLLGPFQGPFIHKHETILLAGAAGLGVVFYVYKRQSAGAGSLLTRAVSQSPLPPNYAPVATIPGGVIDNTAGGGSDPTTLFNQQLQLQQTQFKNQLDLLNAQTQSQIKLQDAATKQQAALVTTQTNAQNSILAHAAQAQNNPFAGCQGFGCVGAGVGTFLKALPLIGGFL